MSQPTHKKKESELESLLTVEKFNLGELYQAVIWQFPYPKEGGFCAGVRLAESTKEWVPAIVYTEQQLVAVYTTSAKKFTSPESAADWLKRQKMLATAVVVSRKSMG